MTSLRKQRIRVRRIHQVMRRRRRQDAIDVPRRQLGWLKDKINVAADFDAPLPDELLDDFEGCRPGR
ncbi:hypothetical protein [Roseateles sp.]|uniref:hypothetical protein n=1 Tax=Roseateles sp. TaxID=1971397 RepID=UPI0039ECA3CC